jgi:type II secretory pathway pseudopilin PulG
VTEVLVVVSIIAALAGLLLPVFANAKKSALERVCASNLHQLQLAVQIYRSDYDGDSRFGKGSEMGLPPASGDIFKTLGVKSELLRCTAPPNVLSPKGAVYVALFAEADEQHVKTTWKEYSQAEGDESFIFADMNHGDPTVSITSPYFPHRALGVRLSGQIKTFTKTGNWGDLAWWSTPAGG